MILHIIKQSPYQNTAIQHCLAIAKAEDIIVLIEDAVLNVLDNNIITKHKNVLVLNADLIARGLLDKIDSTIKLIDYNELVNLTIESQAIVNW